MQMRALHSWQISLKEAAELQKKLSHSLILDCSFPPCRHIAAVDISHNLGDPWLHAGALVYDIESAEVVERASESKEAIFPYIPGYLSFRELPAVLGALAKIKTPCQAVLVDGQGIAHPRGLGIASHLGLWLNLPTIGCAKSRLFGNFVEPGLERGSRSSLFSKFDQKVVGAAVRTRSNIKPIFVSQGHLCDLNSAIELVMILSGTTRLPTPSHLVHRHANQIRQNAH